MPGLPTETPLAAAPPRTGRSPRGPKDLGVKITFIAVIAVLTILVILPLLQVLLGAFGPKGLEVLSGALTNPINRRIIGNTMLLGVVVGAAGTLVGFIFAYVQVRLKLPGKKILNLIAMIPIVSPPFALATSVITLFGRSGVISNQILGQEWNIYGMPGLTLVLGISFFPVAYMNFKGMLSNLDPSLDEAAANLGASKLQTFVMVTLPMLLPGTLGSFMLLFVEAIADLANPVVLGGDFTVLSARAYIAIAGEYNVAAGAAYSVQLLVPALLVFLLQRYWVKRKSVVSVTGKPAGRAELITAPALRWPMGIAVYLLSAFIVVVYATVIVGGFVKNLGVNNTFTLDNFAYILSGFGTKAMVDTTRLALIAMPLAGVFGIVVAWLVVRKLGRSSGWLDFLGMLGVSVPGTVLGIGYALAFNVPTVIGGRQFLPALAGGSAIFAGAIAIVMMYVARSSPSAQRSGIASLQQIHPAIDEAATSLGATSLVTFWKVTLPLIWPALLSGLIYAFSRSMVTLSPIIFITLRARES
ncbi:ABC transporter permease [Tessaracoccus sp.]|uniref:ABC transporter permease n=1 Tax=Tessaracoccus sp. TaxID=1971211 RepID=UPI002606AC2E|nr:iron ABC transporter permease [Tessaracoccus sp.]